MKESGSTSILANTSMEVVLGLPFLALSKADIQFDTGSPTWRTYIAAEALPIARQVELIDKREFAEAALDKNFPDLCGARSGFGGPARTSRDDNSGQPR